MQEIKKRTLRIINPRIVVIPILSILHLILIGAIDTIAKKTSVKSTPIHENHGYGHRFEKFSIFVTVIVLSLFLIPLVSAQTPITGPGVITSPGTYYLQNDITTTTTCIQITSADVVFDGMRYTTLFSLGEDQI
jgi:hypothetical protein